MSIVAALGYLGIETSQTEAWIQLARDVLGLKVEAPPEPDGSVRMRMDDRWARLIVAEGKRETITHFGWEVRDAKALDELSERLEEAHCEPVAASTDYCTQRQVQGLVSCKDPAGNELEFFHNQRRICEPFYPSPHVSSFKTDELGLGHVVLEVEHIEECLAFYTEVLGFRITDQLAHSLYFLRCNKRHHSLALASLNGQNRVLHIMLEVASLDDVGRVFDRSLDRDIRMSTLGVHVNDLVTSFYLETPSGYEIEYGWNGRLVDDATWVGTAIDRPSLWGHRELEQPARVHPRRFQKIAKAT
jgi:2,3-dihydroxybiphenyl 1,2-dioxygenase